MKSIYGFSLGALVLVAACSAPPTDDLSTKKKQLDSARVVMAELKEKIAALEQEIRMADPEALRANAVLVQTHKLSNKGFEHFIDVRGTVESRKNVLLSSLSGGEIEKVFVREGQQVSRGQLLVELDTEVLRSSIADLQSSLELATTVYNRQEKLWKQNIGTELQYLEAKNRKESIEQKLKGLTAQLEQMQVRAPFSGTIDRVDALEGQMASPGFPLIRMLSQDDMYIKADVSEEFIGRLKAGDKVEVYFPVQDKKVNSVLSSVGQVINPENRTFSAEVKLAPGFIVNPNQVVIVNLQDYSSKQGFTVPTKYIQRDKIGQFIYVVEMKHAVSHAKKIYVKIGRSYNGNTEIIEGLDGTEVIIGEGFRDVTDGAEVALDSSKTQTVASN